MNRRRFLKYLTAGLALAPMKAGAYGVLPSLLAGAGGMPAPWASWNEMSQDSLTGIDYICVHDGSGSNDIGTSPTGVISGASLTLTGVNNPTAATQDASGFWSRNMVSASSMYFTNAIGLTAVIDTADRFCLIQKFQLANLDTLQTMFYWWSVAGDAMTFEYDGNADDDFTCASPNNLGMSNGDDIVYTPAALTDLWFVCQCNGTNNTWMGISTSKPITKSGMSATFDGAGQSAFADAPPFSNATAMDIWRDDSNRYWNGKIYYTLIHSDAVIIE